MAKCTFCGYEVERGTGKLYVFKTGKTANFCSSKCEKNMLKLKRKARRLPWTANYEKGKKK
ncbi:50S ribosomal protein L24e [Candidatus Woesearchaeota archaeon]|nr:50S ribosomal protein L24e [Candidatus Woesearchaeota archaeon]